MLSLYILGHCISWIYLKVARTSFWILSTFSSTLLSRYLISLFIFCLKISFSDVWIWRLLALAEILGIFRQILWVFHFIVFFTHVWKIIKLPQPVHPYLLSQLVLLILNYLCIQPWISKWKVILNAFGLVSERPKIYTIIISILAPR